MVSVQLHLAFNSDKESCINNRHLGTLTFVSGKSVYDFSSVFLHSLLFSQSKSRFYLDLFPFPQTPSSSIIYEYCPPWSSH
jgi:hypothetical protein